MAKKQSVQEEVSPNLIPMIDIMFLLLLFFMLGADMGQRELEEVRLPSASSVREDKDTKEKGSERLTVNVYHMYEEKNKPQTGCDVFKRGEVCRAPNHWRIAIKGKDFQEKELVEWLRAAADSFRANPKDSKSPSERPVMVRADAQAPYGEVQKVIASCARAGMYKIECGAARPAAEANAEDKAKK
jgi:biopolymer transport protein ExbD